MNSFPREFLNVDRRMLVQPYKGQSFICFRADLLEYEEGDLLKLEVLQSYKGKKTVETGAMYISLSDVHYVMDYNMPALKQGEFVDESLLDEDKEPLQKDYEE